MELAEESLRKWVVELWKNFSDGTGQQYSFRVVSGPFCATWCINAPRYLEKDELKVEEEKRASQMCSSRFQGQCQRQTL